MCDSASPWLSAWDRAGAPGGLEAFDSDSLCVSRGKQAQVFELGSSKRVAGRPGGGVQLSVGSRGHSGRWESPRGGEPAECWAHGKGNQPFSSFRRC